MKVNDWIAAAMNVAKVMFLVASLFLFSCEKKTNGPGDGPDGGPDDGSNGGSSGTNTELFVSFKTPGWSEKIDCSHLSFQPQSCTSYANSVYYVTATSASTKMSFQISYPTDSARVSKLAIGQQFPFRFNTCAEEEAMQEAISFMVVVPESKGNTNRWMPIPEMNEKSYATLKSVTYVKSDKYFAHYRITGTYTQLSALADANHDRISDDDKVVSGDFQLMIMTDHISVEQKPERQPDQFYAQSATEWVGYVDNPLKDKLEVRVKNEDGRYLENIAVTWVVTKGGGAVSETQTLTDQNGYAATEWTLGGDEFQEVEARVTRHDDREIDPVVFKAEAAANRIVVLSGDEYSGQTAAPLAKPIVLQVLDRHDQPISGVDLYFTISKGNGVFKYAIEDNISYGISHAEFLDGETEQEGIELIDKWVMGTPGEPQELKVAMRNFQDEVIYEHVIKATSYDSLAMYRKKIPGNWVLEWDGGQRDYYEIRIPTAVENPDGDMPLNIDLAVTRRYTEYPDGHIEGADTDENGKPKWSHCWLEYSTDDHKYWLKIGGSYFVHFWGWLSTDPLTFHATADNYTLRKE